MELNHVIQGRNAFPQGVAGKLNFSKKGDVIILLHTVSSTIDFLGGGISPAGGGIYPSARGRNLDFCLCTIPTVGLYGKLGEIAATH